MVLKKTMGPMWLLGIRNAKESLEHHYTTDFLMSLTLLAHSHSSVLLLSQRFIFDSKIIPMIFVPPLGIKVGVWMCFEGLQGAYLVI